MKALSFTKSLLEDFDESTCIIKRSGKHTKKSDATDRTKIVQELMKSNAFMPQANRKFSVFRDIKPSLLAGFDIQYGEGFFYQSGYPNFKKNAKTHSFSPLF
jgi:hypothetical protein